MPTQMIPTCATMKEFNQKAHAHIAGLRAARAARERVTAEFDRIVTPPAPPKKAS